jgi:hypothetical protein
LFKFQEKQVKGKEKNQLSIDGSTRIRIVSVKQKKEGD